MRQHLEDLHSSVNQYFPDDPCVKLQNHTVENASLKVPDRPMGFNVTEHARLRNTTCQVLV